MSRLVTIGEAARELGVSPKTLRRYEARGLIKSIRTMGGQRRYYLSTLEDILASAEDDEGEADEPQSIATAKSVTPPTPIPRNSTAWDAVDRERAALEALKVRSEREALLSSRDRERVRFQEEDMAKAERNRLDAARREEEEQQSTARMNEEKEHLKNINLQIAVSELWIAQEPVEAHPPLRRALAQLLTPARIPVGTPAHRMQQQVRDEIMSVAEPFRRVQELRERGMAYAEQRFATFTLSYSDTSRLRELVEEELCDQVTKDWTTRSVQALVVGLIDEYTSPSDD